MYQDVDIHPSSSLFGRRPLPRAVLFVELVVTTRPYIRSVTAINEQWLSELVPDYFKGKHALPQRGAAGPAGPAGQPARGQRAGAGGGGSGGASTGAVGGVGLAGLAGSRRRAAPRPVRRNMMVDG